MTVEESLKGIMLERYGSVKECARQIQMPYGTLDAILRRGVLNSGLQNVLQICEGLHISADALADGKIIPSGQDYRPLADINERLAFFIGNIDGSTLDGIPLTEEEIRVFLDSIDSALYIIRRNRK